MYIEREGERERKRERKKTERERGLLMNPRHMEYVSDGVRTCLHNLIFLTGGEAILNRT